MAKTLIGDVQSRITKRTVVLSQLECEALRLKNLARYFDENDLEQEADICYKSAANLRATIRPIAKDQRVDRDIVQALCSAVVVGLELSRAMGQPYDVPGFKLAGEN